MKQIIERYSNGSIRTKFYKNHLNQFNGLCINYCPNGNILYKRNYLNDKLIGVDSFYYNNSKPTKIKYNL